MGVAGAASPVPGVIGSDDRVRQPRDAGWPWSAIGRVNRETGGFCTGTLVAPDQVLTAAHCLWNRRTGRLMRPQSLHFAAGWWRGEALAHARAAAIATAPGLAFGRDGRPTDLAADWAVLTLERPLDGLRPVPLAADPPAAAGDAATALARAGYGRDRPNVLSRQDGCHRLGTAAGGAVLLHDCDATFGDSGSPILLDGPDGYALLAVHVAMTEAAGHPAGAAVIAGPEVAAAIR
ncbi:MAG: trypsin-like serine protease [Geminicoccaceae bacterium]